MLLQVLLEGIGLGVLLVLVCAIGIRKERIFITPSHIFLYITKHLMSRLKVLHSSTVLY